jgi:hypothetical protein
LLTRGQFAIGGGVSNGTRDYDMNTALFYSTFLTVSFALAACGTMPVGLN